MNIFCVGRISRWIND